MNQICLHQTNGGGKKIVTIVGPYTGHTLIQFPMFVKNCANVLAKKTVVLDAPVENQTYSAHLSVTVPACRENRVLCSPKLL